MSLAKNLLRARKRANITQAELARRLNKSKTSVCEWESGEHKPRVEDLPTIASILNTTIDRLLAA